ncbi:class I adenylate-forming enzyme family protein [Telmatospirillum siberiense]|uniref:Acetyl-CoA synthetase n=1 Tax=Telmatospirillum siberiense TaxID=382514 RepID=A0A2N3PV80_9PROT|nr:class I adenylate-forming enzyme family protein [Telmatospirillum siberiense]PKU24298.1 acetyl-CoA synthetase [Telmatospirillum siberiense]
MSATAPSANLGDVIDRTADPQDIAFIGLDGSQQATEYRFGDIDERADAFARALLAEGFRQGERIALFGANSVDYVIALLGIMRAGLTAVPVNFKLPAAQVDYVLRDSEARLVFCDGERRSQVPADLPSRLLGTPPADAGRAEAPFVSFQPGPDDVALLLYTSGSSGRPKGVLLSHASHRWVVDIRRIATPLADERVLIAAPLYHMNALALVLLTLASHASAVLLPQFNATAYIGAIDRYRCTWLTAVPPMIAMMLRERDALAKADLGSVRVVRMGSAPVSPSLLEQTRRLLPNARVINAYGTTEGSPVVFGPHPKGLPTPPQSVGYPHPAVALRLIDEQGRDGAEGVLELKSPGLMLGYHRRDDLAPFTADGYYVTGDVFRRDADGFYSFVRRRDDMFVSGGENIYPGEVEHALERHPAVQQACVVPVPDDIKGTKPVAFVVPRQGVAVPDEATLKGFSLRHLAAYQHPRRIWFIEALPLAATQKIDRRALAAEALRRLEDRSS